MNEDALRRTREATSLGEKKSNELINYIKKNGLCNYSTILHLYSNKDYYGQEIISKSIRKLYIEGVITYNNLDCFYKIIKSRLSYEDYEKLFNYISYGGNNEKKNDVNIDMSYYMNNKSTPTATVTPTETLKSTTTPIPTTM